MVKYFKRLTAAGVYDSNEKKKKKKRLLMVQMIKTEVSIGVSMNGQKLTSTNGAFRSRSLDPVALVVFAAACLTTALKVIMNALSKRK